MEAHTHGHIDGYTYTQTHGNTTAYKDIQILCNTYMQILAHTDTWRQMQIQKDIVAERMQAGRKVIKHAIN